MKTTKTLFIAIVIVMFVLGLQARAQTLSQDSWTSYCGWHYGKPSAWGGWVREPVPNRTGTSLMDTATKQIDTLKLSSLFDALASLDTTVDIMLMDGGVGGARDTARLKAYMRMIENDKGAFWKDVIYKQCMRLAQLPNSKDRLYYQLGNEITSAACVSAFRYWQGEAFGGGVDYDRYIIPFFVENFIAPTIEAVDSSSMDYYGQKGLINICMGSITNAGSPDAVQFLDSLLNYTVAGTNAPSLAGKKVYELFHIITIHYMMGNSSSNVWQRKIDTYAKWFGTGRIRGIWSTEEVGINKASSGAGAAYGARATFRYLKWAIDSNYSSAVARTNYWAWDVGPANTRVDDFNSELLTFLGHVRLSYVNPAHTSFTSSTNPEWHGFLDSASSKGILAVLSPSLTVSQLQFATSAWGNINDVRLTRYDTTGSYDIPITLSRVADSVRLTFPAQDLTTTVVLLFKIRTQPLSVGVATDEATDSTLILYADPTSESLSIHHSTPGCTTESVTIYNGLGSMVFSSSLLSDHQAIDMREWARGPYYVNILSSDGRAHTRKVILQ